MSKANTKTEIRKTPPVWLCDLPARKWIEQRLDKKDADRPPTPIELWAAGKPTAAMWKGLPLNVAAVGKERIVVLCKVWISVRKALRQLIHKGRRVAPKKPSGEPDHAKNVLRRIEEGSMGLKDEHVQDQIMQAIKRKDKRWFINLGEALQIGTSEKPVADFHRDRISLLDYWLACLWFSVPDNGSPESSMSLCYFTDQALSDFYRKIYTTASPNYPNMGLIRKRRERLGLLRPGPPTIKEFPPKPV